MIDPMLLTKDTTFIIGPIATILGYLMNGIFVVLDKLNIPSTGLAIIFFTLIIYLLMLPLTIKQQKFSKLSQKLQPEITKIQNKYKGRTDQDSQLRMSEETQAVYKKYGINPMGSCIQLLIQMPILFALYRVIYNIPAYVTKVKEAFYPLVTNLMAQAGASEYLQETTAGGYYSSRFTSDNFINNVGDTVANTFIDVLNRFSSSDWNALSEEFTEVADDVAVTVSRLTEYNNFLGLNIGNSPWYTFQQAIAAGSFLAVIGAVAVPVLAAVTQFVNVALTPQQSNNNSGGAMMDSMKTMNVMMPILSAWFCFTLPAGMGLYWISGSIIRSIQQVVINRYIDRMDMDAYLQKQADKADRKAEKRGNKPTAHEQMMEYASMNTRKDTPGTVQRKKTLAEKADYQNRPARDSYSQNTSAVSSVKYKEGSLAQKAHLVEAYNNADRGTTGRSSRSRNKNAVSGSKSGTSQANNRTEK